MLYNPPSGSTDANAPYIRKIVAAGTQGSKVPPEAVEYTQREIVAAITASGQAPTNTVLVQAALALGRGIWVGALTGSGDLAVATLNVVLPSLLQGMRIGAVAAVANTVTNPKLRIMNLGSAGTPVDFPILRSDGSALAAGDIVAGRLYRFEADGAGNVLISGGGLGSSASVTPTTINNIINSAPTDALVLASAANTIASQSGSGTKLTAFGTVTNNISDRITWNTGTARATVVKSGWYWVQMYLETNFPVGNYAAFLAMNKNGNSASSVGEVNASTTSAVLGPNFSTQRLIYLTAGDYCEFFCGQNSGSSQNGPVAVLIEAKGV